MRFVDIDEIYRRIEEEHDHLATSCRFNDPVRASCKGLRKALHMMNEYILEQEKEDAETEKGREVFLWQLLRDQDERQLAEISRAIHRKVERLSQRADGVSDHPDAPTGPSSGPADDGEASHSQVWTGMERPAGAVAIDGESVVFAFPQPDGSVHYESTRVRSVVVENDIVTISEALGTGAEDEGDLRAWTEKIRNQAAKMAEMAVYPSSFIEERGIRVEEAGPGPYLVARRWLPNGKDAVVDYPGESPVWSHSDGMVGKVESPPADSREPDGGRPSGLRGGASGVREEGLGHSIPIQGPSGGIAQYPAQSLVPGSIARGTGEA